MTGVSALIHVNLAVKDLPVPLRPVNNTPIFLSPFLKVLTYLSDNSFELPYILLGVTKGAVSSKKYSSICLLYFVK